MLRHICKVKPFRPACSAAGRLAGARVLAMAPARAAPDEVGVPLEMGLNHMVAAALERSTKLSELKFTGDVRRPSLPVTRPADLCALTCDANSFPSRAWSPTARSRASLS